MHALKNDPCAKLPLSLSTDAFPPICETTKI